MICCLSIVASHDTITLTDFALASYEQALEPKKLVLIPGGHFDPYRDQFPVAEAAATQWFCEHLVGSDAPPRPTRMPAPQHSP